MATAAQLKALRRKYRLGEFSPKATRRRRTATKAPAKKKYPVRRRKPGTPKLISPYSIFGKTKKPI